jgi:hypothetical protein
MRTKDALNNISADYFDSIKLDTTPPTITINNPDTSPATAKAITASIDD